MKLNIDGLSPVMKIYFFKPLRVLGNVRRNLLARSVREMRVDLVRVFKAVDRDQLAKQSVFFRRPDLPQLVRRTALLHVA